MKFGLVAAVAVAGALALSPLAFADDEGDDGYGSQGEVYQHEVQECDKDILSGVFAIPDDSNAENDSDDDVDCDQELSPDEDD